MNLNFRLVLSFIVILSLKSFAQSTAKIDTLVVSADVMTRDLKENKIFLNGKVHLIFQGQNIRADTAVINTKEKSVIAEGNLSLVSPGARATGSQAKFNYEDETGILYDAYIEKGPKVQLRGKIIRKVGPEDYIVESGDFTACTNCPPSWSLSGSKINATMGRYAYISHPVMYFGKVPVFYLPYLIVPIATERQTGFLFPTLGYGDRSKFVFSQPFFWAMSDSTDSTWTFENYQGRGQKGNLNYRYRLSERSKGEFNTGFINDGALSTELKERGYRLQDFEKIQRSFVRYWHYYELPEGYVQRADINWASDTLYPKDFMQDFRGSGGDPANGIHGDPAMVSRVSVTKNSDLQHISVEATHNRNMLATDPRGADDRSVHRYPSIMYALTPQQLSGNLLFEMEARYTNFTRNGPVYDKIKANGDERDTPIEIDPNPSDPDFYNSGIDLLRSGQRLELEPKVSYPFNLGPYLDIDPSISFRETDYEFGVRDNPSAYRRYFRGTVSARTQVGRVFGNTSDPKSIRYKHEFQPEIVYTNIPWLDHSKHPFLGDSDPFYKRDQALGNSDSPQFDDFDRLYDRHLTTFNLTNYLIKKTPFTEGANYTQVANLKLSQGYDNYEATRSTLIGEAREPWTPLVGTLDLRLNFLDSNTVARYYHYDKLTAISSRLRLTHSSSYIEMNYSQDFLLKKISTQDADTGLFNTRTDLSNYGQSLHTLAGHRFKYISLAGYVTYNVLTERWTQYGYMIELNPPGDCWIMRFQETRPITESGGESFYTFNIGINYGAGTEAMDFGSFSKFR